MVGKENLEILNGMYKQGSFKRIYFDNPHPSTSWSEANTFDLCKEFGKIESLQQTLELLDFSAIRLYEPSIIEPLMKACNLRVLNMRDNWLTIDKLELVIDSLIPASGKNTNMRYLDLAEQNYQDMCPHDELVERHGRLLEKVKTSLVSLEIFGTTFSLQPEHKISKIFCEFVRDTPKLKYLEFYCQLSQGSVKINDAEVRRHAEIVLARPNILPVLKFGSTWPFEAFIHGLMDAVGK